MVVVLRIFGWFGILLSCFNGYFKVFGDDATVARYAGSSRDLDLNITIVAFCLIFLALAAILAELRE